ncbi:MAG: LysE family translocator [Proteobacteria bacterium]|nr:LysE family translocator [Pseudomonadota bacterium]
MNPLLAFALTAFIIELTPGPNMAYLAALSLSQGMKAGLAAVAGIALGLSVYGIAAALGLTAIIDSSRLLYELLRWAGVAYLLWLAWEGWTRERETSPSRTGEDQQQPWPAFRRGLITNLLNPKAAVFYVAMLPEFIRDDGRTVLIQTVILSGVYVGIATAVHAVIVIMAGSLQNVVSTADRRRRVRRALALVLVAIAVWFAFSTGRTR